MMNKQEFIDSLRKGLVGLPQQETEDRIAFYSEIIDDRIEEGYSEEEAVLSVGNINEIVEQIIAEIPFSQIAKQRIKPKRRLKVWEIVLLVLGSPIWLSLILAAVAIILSLYVSLWSVLISLWAVFSSLIGCVLGGIAAGIVTIIFSNVYTGIISLAAGITCAGLSIFMFYGCKTATKVILMLTKKIALWIKNCFIKKGEA